MRSARTIFLVLLLVSTISSGSSAQTQPGAEEILRNVRETYRQLKTYQFEYRKTSEQKTEMEGLIGESKQQAAGTVWVASSDRSRTEAKDSNNRLVKIVDGRITWTYVPALKAYTRREADADGKPSRQEWFDYSASEALGYIRNYSALGSSPPRSKQTVNLLREEAIEIAGQKLNCYVIEISSPESGPTKFSRQYWIEKNSYLVAREKYTSTTESRLGSTSSSSTIATFNYIKLNIPLADDLFFFEPPAGTEEVAKFDYFESAAKNTKILGKPALDFTLNDLSGKEINLQKLRGKIVLLNFWATWCGPCVAEMPDFEKLHREFKDKDLVILAVSDEEPQVAREFLQKNNFTFTSLVDTERKVWELYQIAGIPQSFFISKEGNVIEHFVGTLDENRLRSALEKTRRAADGGTSPVVADKAPPNTYACVPQLISPKQADVLPNSGSGDPKKVAWVFSWANCPGAARFHLEVKAAKARFPLYDNATLHSLSYRFQLGRSRVEESNLSGWTWRVRAQTNGRWGEWSEQRTFAVEPDKNVTVSLPAPKLVAPASKSVFDHYPRETRLVWEMVSGAASYQVEIDFRSPSSPDWNNQLRGVSNWTAESKTTSHTFNFVGAQPGRWRVWAVDAEGRQGAKSEWWEFVYTR
ncbi:MAG TPA: redoxin domain-containing protein [Blastocatellia bacterium]|nr:redoxin domain-containing protein [Blastocatellia bacterium]